MSYTESHCVGCETCTSSCRYHNPIHVFVCEDCGKEMYHEPDVDAGSDTYYCYDCAESMEESEDEDEEMEVAI